ncbi:TM2 domain-containing protein [Thioclava atlantica]|uniref:TM2 domain-containing protein domain-containing protein n=1 Tax=Thioclava atlantica TaxID=1317124 RepID=A0A085TUL1_9RHOB|nr:TM2 domain-containing protein [Thioclava atlantica]KFE34408.1 TM2 domain-containing protein domain-containing protein [Thioclava atlantica]
MTRDDARALYIEQRVANEKKSALAAYLLWFLLPMLGVHRMYLGRVGSGIIMLLLTGLGTLFAPVLIGYIPLAFVGLWWLIDALLIPGMISQGMAETRWRLMQES